MVAKTGLLIETRVNHMTTPLRSRTEGFVHRHREAHDFEADDAGFDAVGAERCATTLAGAPSFRLSKRAATTCTSGFRPRATSMRPAVASVRPVTTMRRTSISFSSVHT